MPKRKRGAYEEGGGRAIIRGRRDVEERITQDKKVLQKALKAAKGFERQRLGKRLTNARGQGNDGDIKRINKEIEILKGLDLGKVGEMHLRKTILKVKAFAESELLPAEIRAEVENPEMGEEDLKAWNNVLSRLCNMKPLKEAMSQIIGGLYSALGVPAPDGKQTGETKQPEKGLLGADLQPTEASKDVSGDSVDGEDQLDGLVWEGFDSGDDKTPDVDAEEDGMDIEDEDLDEEELSRYAALLGGSSDEESFDEEQYKSNRAPGRKGRLSLSQSPTPSPDTESEPVSSLLPKVSKAPKTKPTAAKVGGSTFLPTLMGGYYAGSDSSASDVNEKAVNNRPAKKNRPGQMARQAIWEKRYGQRANHIRKGLGPVAERKEKDDGWDAKRGAKGGGVRGGFGGRRGGRGHERGWGGGDRVTGENSTAVGERNMGMGKKDHVGVLHPSWQAAKKAKEMKKAATFQGKKVVFD